MLSFALALAMLRSNTLALLSGAVLSRHRGDLFHLDAGVPQVEVGHPGQAADRLAVGVRHRPVDRRALLRVEVPIRLATAKLATSRLTSHSNGPGSVSSKSLMPNTSADRARRTPEVGQMRIAAELHSSPVSGHVQVGGHRIGRAAEEGERRDQHPSVAEGHELWHREVSCSSSISTGSRRSAAAPIRHAGARHHRPRRLSARRPLLPGEVLLSRAASLAGCRPARAWHALEFVVAIGDVLDSRHRGRSLSAGAGADRGVRDACGGSIGTHHTALPSGVIALMA